MDQIKDGWNKKRKERQMKERMDGRKAGRKKKGN